MLVNNTRRIVPDTMEWIANTPMIFMNIIIKKMMAVAERLIPCIQSSSPIFGSAASKTRPIIVANVRMAISGPMRVSLLLVSSKALGIEPPGAAKTSLCRSRRFYPQSFRRN